MRNKPGFSDSDSDTVTAALEAQPRASTAVESRATLEDIGKLFRSAPNPRDATLSDVASAWIAKLPDHQQPLALSRRYPRIANRLALCWDDKVLTAKVFTQLLQGRRINRRGFPPEVHRELLSLRAHFLLTAGALAGALGTVPPARR
jgi:hypothetical protein